MEYSAEVGTHIPRGMIRRTGKKNRFENLVNLNLLGYGETHGVVLGRCGSVLGAAGLAGGQDRRGTVTTRDGNRVYTPCTQFLGSIFSFDIFSLLSLI